MILLSNIFSLKSHTNPLNVASKTCQNLELENIIC